MDTYLIKIDDRYFVNTNEEDFFIGLEYMDYLIKQTERVRELEEENKRYREALEFYADEETYETKFVTHTDEIYDPFTLIDFFTLVELDGGEKARKALEGEE